jgi:UDP-N-acetylmuramate dehydrogenase
VARAIEGDIRFNEPMARHTSWRVGGNADVFFMPKNLRDLSEYLCALPTPAPDIFFCGLGSNTLVRDGGIRGVVIATQKFLNQIDRVDDLTIRAEAGVSCATLARFSARENLSGIEFLAGVPGTVGGALAMNAGCHGGETWPRLIAVELINRQGQISTLPASEFAYGYRHVPIPFDHWFVAGLFQLTAGDKQQSLQTIRDLLARRAATQPANEPSGGSTFRNPPGDFAARLIENCGLKSYQIGGAMVSPKHANFIVNVGDCSAADIENLIYYVQREVKQQKGIELILEVKIVGENRV